MDAENRTMTFLKEIVLLKIFRGGEGRGDFSDSPALTYPRPRSEEIYFILFFRDGESFGEKFPFSRKRLQCGSLITALYIIWSSRLG